MTGKSILHTKTRTGKYSFPCSADHEQDWRPYPVDPYSCYTGMCDHTYGSVEYCQATPFGLVDESKESLYGR